MAVLKQIDKNRWQATIDLKGNRKKKTITGKANAKAWADEYEAKIERRAAGLMLAPTGTVGELVTRYETELWQYKKWGDTKAYNLKKLREEIGNKPLASFIKEWVIDYGKQMAKTRGPNGVKERLSYLSDVFKQARNLWSIDVNVDAVTQGMSALNTLGLSGEGDARTRRVSEEEIDIVRAAATRTDKSVVNLPAVIDILSVLPLRVSELCRIKWEDFRESDRSVLIRQRKHPTKKERNDEWVALPTVGGVDTYKMLTDRPRYFDRPFPYRSKTVSSLFWLAHNKAGIVDFHLHDLRAHAISFMLAFLQPQIVASISGHKNWTTMAKHYARLTPDQVHAAIARAGVDKATARAVLRLVEKNEQDDMKEAA